MKVYLHEIKEIDSELDFTQEAPWVRATIENLDEEPSDLGPPRKPRAERKIDLHFNLRRVDDVYVVSGDIDTQVHLLCSRCAKPFDFPVQEHFSSLYCKDKEMAGIAYLDAKAVPRGQNKGYARHAHLDTEGSTGSEATADLDITYLDQEYLDLSQVVSEQLRLRIPYQPLCREDCKGVCPNCGTDLNSGRCACAKILGKNPFSVIKDLKG